MEIQPEFVMVSIWISKQDIFVRVLSPYLSMDLYMNVNYLYGSYMDQFQTEFVVFSIWICKYDISTTR